MRYEKDHKAESHRRILEAASREFRKNGIATVGIATIMKEAGLTNGAFYAHFASKEALIAEVLGNALDQRDAELVEALKKGLTVEQLICAYLSPRHRNDCEGGCTIAALISELIHHSKSTRKLLTEKIERDFNRIADQLVGTESARKRQAIPLLSMMIGALQLARAVTDKDLSDQILRSASNAAIELATSEI